MRERRLILDGSICQGDFIDGVDTIAELRAAERVDCRFFPTTCPALSGEGPYCIPKGGNEVARYTVKLGTSVDEEMADFSRMAPRPSRGYFDPTIEEPDAATTDRDEVVRRVRQWAEKILGIQPVDAASLNHEFSSPDAEVKYAVQKQSVFDEETGHWVHSCGSTLSVATVNHSVHLRAMPLTGSGEVRQEQVPFCATCESKPGSNGGPWYQEDLDTEEVRQLGRLGGDKP